MKIIEMQKRNKIDLENLVSGAYHPIRTFQNKKEVSSILEDMCIPDGTVWTIPIILDTNESDIKIGEEVRLNYNGEDVAILEVNEFFDFEKERFCSSVFGTTDKKHPGVIETYSRGRYLVGGRITEILNQKLHKRVGYVETIKNEINEHGWKTVSGFQTRNPPHRGHEHLLKIALEITDGLLITPVLGIKKRGDFTDEAIIKGYEALIEHYLPDNVMLRPIPLNMYYAGPKEAIVHAQIRKNYGCTHFIIGRDHAGYSNFYLPYEAQEIFKQFNLGIEIIKVKDSFYCKRCDCYGTDKTCNHDKSYREYISGTKIREMLCSRETISPIMIRPEVQSKINELNEIIIGG